MISSFSIAFEPMARAQHAPPVPDTHGEFLPIQGAGKMGNRGMENSDEGVAHGDSRCLAAIGCPQLAQDIADVVPDGLGADEEGLGDLEIS